MFTNIILATLVFVSGGVSQELTAPLTLDQQPDAMFCSMVRAKIAYLDKINRKIEYLQTLLVSKPNKVTKQQLDELKALENRRLADTDFLSSPGPVMRAKWEVPLSSAQLEQLNKAQATVEIESFIVNWKGAGPYGWPKNVKFQAAEDGVQVALAPQVSDYCLDQAFLRVKLEFSP